MGVFTVDEASEAVWFSDELRRIFGFGPHDTLPGRDELVRTMFTSTQRDTIDEAQRVVEDHGRAVVFETVIERPDGDTRSLLVHVEREVVDGVPTGLWGTAQDITALRPRRTGSTRRRCASALSATSSTSSRRPPSRRSRPSPARPSTRATTRRWAPAGSGATGTTRSSSTSTRSAWPWATCGPRDPRGSRPWPSCATSCGRTPTRAPPPPRCSRASTSTSCRAASATSQRCSRHLRPAHAGVPVVARGAPASRAGQCPGGPEVHLAPGQRPVGFFESTARTSSTS